MMSQNRQEEKDRKRAENDYKVNLKSEILMEDMSNKIKRILARQESILRVLKDAEFEENQILNDEETKKSNQSEDK